MIDVVLVGFCVGGVFVPLGRVVSRILCDC